MKKLVISALCALFVLGGALTLYQGYRASQLLTSDQDLIESLKEEAFLEQTSSILLVETRLQINDQALHLFMDETQGTYYAMMCDVIDQGVYGFSHMEDLNYYSQHIVYTADIGFMPTAYLIDDPRCTQVRITDHLAEETTSIPVETPPFVISNEEILDHLPGNAPVVEDDHQSFSISFCDSQGNDLH